MKFEISNKNKIKNSNIGANNKIENESKAKNIIIDILVGLLITIVGGIVVYYLTK